MSLENRSRGETNKKKTVYSFNEEILCSHCWQHFIKVVFDTENDIISTFISGTLITIQLLGTMFEAILKSYTNSTSSDTQKDNGISQKVNKQTSSTTIINSKTSSTSPSSSIVSMFSEWSGTVASPDWGQNNNVDNGMVFENGTTPKKKRFNGKQD
jgi:hypothetical protein